jgi:ankyrin repeat protein
MEDLQKLRHRDQDGDTTLHIAASSGLRFLIEAVVERFNLEHVLSEEIDRLNLLHQSAVYLAAMHNQAEIAAFFLSYGANGNERAFVVGQSDYNQYTTALHQLAVGGKTFKRTLKVFLSCDSVKVNETDARQNTPLFSAIDVHETDIGGGFIDSSDPIR